MAYKMVNSHKFEQAMLKKQRTINKQSRALKKAPKSIGVGWDKASGSYTEQPGQPDVATVAVIHEWGLAGQKESAQLRITKERVEPIIKEYVKKRMKQARRTGKIDYQNLAEEIGRFIKLELKETVFALDLVDTTRLANSIVIRYRRR